MHYWFFLLKITVVKIMNNLNVCSSHSYLYPRYRFNYATCYWNACARPGKWVVIYMCVRDIHLTSISTIVGLDFRTVLTVWIFFFILELSPWCCILELSPWCCILELSPWCCILELSRGVVFQNSPNGVVF